MKTSMHLSFSLASVLLIGALCLSANKLHAGTYTLTTASSDGGFDGWIDLANSTSSTATTLRAGNIGAGYLRSSAILMFDIASLNIDFTQEKITSVVLSYYIVNAYGSTTLTVTHGTKTSESLVYGSSADTPAAVTGTGWSETLGTTAGASGTVVSLSVTAAFLADLNASNTYSSYRIVQADTYGSQIASTAWGAKIASSENTSGYLIPTLTITTVAIPEPANVALLFGGGISMIVLTLRKRRD